MSRPLLEMADIVRCAGQAFIERSCRWINWQHQKVLLAVVRCRTAALGGHRDRCIGCGHTTRISYNSCRNILTISSGLLLPTNILKKYRNCMILGGMRMLI